MKYEVTVNEQIKVCAVIQIDADTLEQAEAAALAKLKSCLGASQALLEACRQAHAALRMQKCLCASKKRGRWFVCARCQAIRFCRVAIQQATPPEDG